MKKSFLFLSALAITCAAQATTYTNIWTVNAVLPDNDYNGWTDSRTINDAPAGTVSDLSVTLNLSGGWNGDLFAYLVNSTGGFCVLLDRPGLGVSGVSSLGYGDAGMTAITLGAIGGSIHAYGAGNTFSSIPTGNYLPDASGTTVANWGGLASFVGSNPNSTWTLFVADLSGGGVTTVQNWGLQLNITAVPEPGTLALVGLGGSGLWLALRRKKA